MEEIDDLSEEYEDVDGYEEYESFLDSLRGEKEELEETHPEIRDKDNIGLIERHKEFIRDREILEEMSDEIDAYAKTMYPEEKGYRSLLLEYFTPDICIDLEKIRRNFDINGDQKMEEIIRVLEKYNIPFSPLGGGTNRYGIMVDGYCVKIAYDSDGMIDNKREFIYSIALQPYVVKTYECSPTGLLSVCEYVASLTREDYTDRKVQQKMREILKDIAENFFIGDVGVTSKNYGNWGIRTTNEELVILDFAYVYSVGYNTFQCSCAGQGMLYYDRDFVELICPVCGKRYTFGQIRKKISKKQQEIEIGNIEEKGYSLTKKYQMKKFNHRFTMGATDRIRRKVEKDKEKARRKQIWKDSKEKVQKYDKSTTFEKVLEKFGLE